MRKRWRQDARRRRIATLRRRLAERDRVIATLKTDRRKLADELAAWEGRATVEDLAAAKTLLSGMRRRRREVAS